MFDSAHHECKHLLCHYDHKSTVVFICPKITLDTLFYSHHQYFIFPVLDLSLHFHYYTTGSIIALLLLHYSTITITRVLLHYLQLAVLADVRIITPCSTLCRRDIFQVLSGSYQDILFKEIIWKTQQLKVYSAKLTVHHIYL